MLEFYHKRIDTNDNNSQLSTLNSQLLNPEIMDCVYDYARWMIYAMSL